MKMDYVNVAISAVQSTYPALTCRRHCHFSLFPTRPGNAGCAQTSVDTSLKFKVQEVSASSKNSIRLQRLPNTVL